ncbi:DNA replication terminus site-binding protein [Bermanella sp. R86510]|uniref:DNA replication terminus site-binding protein n=1 Tax=unclassified Bermanella TaxID=2627862 RepID=UPI0037C724CA
MSVSDIVSQFDQLVDHTEQFCNSLNSQTNPCWIPLTAAEQSAGIAPLEKAKQLYQDYWYQDGQDGRETRSCFGMISITQEQANLAKHINELKSQFKQSVNTLKKQQAKQWQDIRKDLGQRHGIIREQLRYSGLTRLHIKQTWRLLPVIERQPIRIGFNWYHSGRSIQKVTVEEAQKALLNLDTASEHIQTQLSQLHSLPGNTPLAKVQNLAPTMRANIFFDSVPSRQAMNVSLPILFVGSHSLPQHNEPPLTPPRERERARRSDAQIEDQAFLPSIRVHRYLIP